MDFDEYEYLEKTVENPELKDLEQAVNGGDEKVKSGEKDSRRQSSRHRGEEDEDLDRKSKRSRNGDDGRDRDRHREKSSSRRRSRSREGERGEKDGERHRSGREHRDRDKDKEREERNGRDRDRDKDREGERDKDRDRDSGRKERHREKEGEKDRDEHDRRSRSHSVRRREDREKSRDREHREKSREREPREKSREREFREKSREREYREKSRDRDLRDRDPRRHKEKKDDGNEPEVDPERDQRTVFAYQLPLRADERDIFEFFSRAGKVRDVRLIMDRNSRRSKGVGYIEFYDVMSVPMAIALSGQLIRGQPVMVKPSEAEKNLVQSTSTAAGGGLTGSGAARRLYVGNLIPNITEEQLRVVFETFGTIELVQLPRDDAGLCKGFAFVQFARLEDAKAAQTLNGQLDIGGRVMKVSAVTDQPGMQDAGATTGDLDDDEGGGLALNASSRALLMQKLDRSGSGISVGGPLASTTVNTGGISMASAAILGSATGVSPLAAPLMQASMSSLGGMPTAGLPGPPLPSFDTIGVPSECLQLKNMFDPNTETEPDFDLDIKDDVQEECSKFGALKHIFVDKHSEGHVYLKFDNTQAAMSAQQALHGRWFAGKMISATFMLPQNYEVKFPESR